jgi:general L-amino acid transport system permease protein
MAGYVRTNDAPSLPPPVNTTGAVAWMRANLFPTPLSSLTTLLLLGLLVWILSALIPWALINAVWSAPDRELCSVEGVGACWPVVKARFHQWIYGLYPFSERWRVDIVFVLTILSIAGLLIPRIPHKTLNAFFFFVIFPVIAFVLLRGNMFGLPNVDTDQWGGLLVTLVIAITGIVVSLPLGILLALGRRSEMPAISTLCTAFIEMVRGIPLITVLFMASVMFPLFMPPGVNFDKLLKVLIGVALFSGAYMAEVVRGGLQAIPKGQYEAAQAVGLSWWRMMGLVVLPQALKISIPGIVNNAISLFKDTTLVLVVGIFDLLNMAQQGFADAKWASPQTGNTIYFGLAIIYWIFCFAMSRYSLWMERRLNTGHKR